MERVKISGACCQTIIFMRRAILLISFSVLFSCTGKKPISLKITMSETKYDPETVSFECLLYLNNDSITLALADFADTQKSEADSLAVTIKNWLEQNFDRSKEFACSKLIDLKNSRWLKKNEPPVTKREFLKKMTFNGINAFKEGGFEMYFKDGELFPGHWIMIDVNESFEMEDATLRG
jgi:hypothetical protein